MSSAVNSHIPGDRGAFCRLLDYGDTFDHIVEAVLWRLEPRDILAAALVSKQWLAAIQRGGYLDKQRVLRGWIEKQPRTVRRIRVKRCPRIVGLRGGASRPDMPPYCILADSKVIVAASPGFVDAYDRQRGLRSERLLDGQLSAQYTLAMSKGFLIARQPHVFASPMIVFQRLADGRFDRMIDMATPFPDRNLVSVAIHVAGERHEDRFISMQTQPTRHFWCFTVCAERQEFIVLWSLSLKFDAINFHAGFFVLANKEESGVNQCALEVRDSSVGCRVIQPTVFNLGEDFDVIKAVALTSCLAFVIASRLVENADAADDGYIVFQEEETRLYICDVACSSLVREIRLDLAALGDLSRCPLWLWCDPPLGTLMVTVVGRHTNVSQLAVYSMETLLRETRTLELVRPERILDTGGWAHSSSVVPLPHGFICGRFDLTENNNLENVYLEEMTFWYNS